MIPSEGYEYAPDGMEFEPLPAAAMPQASPPPPPPPSNTSADLADSREFVARLASKVQTQAKELAGLQVALDERTKYAALCEQRILALDPSHDVPLSADWRPSSASSLTKAHERAQADARARISALTREVQDMQATLRVRDRERDEAVQHTRRLEKQLRRARSTAANARPPLAAQNGRSPPDGENKEAMDHLATSLRSEAQANEEARAYIAVLENSLRMKAIDFGLDGSATSVELMAEVSRLRADLSARTTSLTQRDERVRLLEGALEEREAEADGLTKRIESLTVDLAAVSRELERYGGGPGGSGKTQADAIKQLEAEKAALLEYVNDSVDRTASTNKALEDMRQTRDALLTESEMLRANNERLTQQANQLSTVATNAQAAVETLQQALSAAETMAEGKRQALESCELTRMAKEQELDEMAQIQTELLNTIRDKSDEATAAQTTVGKLQHRTNVLGDAVETARAELEAAVVAHGTELDTAESTIAELQSEVSARQHEVATTLDRLQKAEELGDTLQREKEALTTERNTLRSEREGQRVRLEQLSSHENDLESAVAELRMRLNGLTTELTTLRELKENLEGVEAAIVSGIEQQQQQTSTPDGRGDGGGDISDPPVDWASCLALQHLSPVLAVRVHDLRNQLQHAERAALQAHTEKAAEEERAKVERELLHNEVSTLRAGRDEVDTELKEARARAMSAVEQANERAIELRSAEEVAEKAMEKASEAVEENGRLARLVADQQLQIEEVGEMRMALLETTSRCNVGDARVSELEALCQELEEMRRESGSQKAALSGEIISLKELLRAEVARADKMESDKAGVQFEARELSAAMDSAQGELISLRIRSNSEHAEHRKDVVSWREELTQAAELAEEQNSLAAELEARLQRSGDKIRELEGSVMTLTSELEGSRYSAATTLSDLMSLHGRSHPAVGQFVQESMLLYPSAGLSLSGATGADSPGSRSVRSVRSSVGPSSSPYRQARAIADAVERGGLREAVQSLGQLARCSLAYESSAESRAEVAKHSAEAALAQANEYRPKILALQAELMDARGRNQTLLASEKRREDANSRLRQAKTEADTLRLQNAELKKSVAEAMVRATEAERNHQSATTEIITLQTNLRTHVAKNASLETEIASKIQDVKNISGQLVRLQKRLVEQEYLCADQVCVCVKVYIYCYIYIYNTFVILNRTILIVFQQGVL